MSDLTSLSSSEPAAVMAHRTHRRDESLPQLGLSVAIITQNEAHQLPGLVASLQFADEIVVVDGGSTDGTAELARQMGCRVFEHAFDRFSAQRNRAIDACAGRWILSIDADERPSHSMANEIRQAIRNPHGPRAYKVRIRSCIFGHPFRFSGTQDDRPVRLFAKDSARWHGDVHERIEVVGEIGGLQAHLSHDTIPNLRSFLRKMDRYTSIEARSRVMQQRAPRRRDRWFAPTFELGRRLIWKGGLLDGPKGWSFCLLSAFSKWVEADKHRQLWRARPMAQPGDGRRSPCSRDSGSFPEPKPRFPGPMPIGQLPIALTPLLIESSPRK